MANPTNLQALLALIPEGSQYQMIKDALIRVAQTFPEQLPEINEARVTGWVNEVNTGTGRDAPRIRDDIFRYIVEPGVIQAKMGVDAQAAEDLITRKGDTQFAKTAGVAQAGDVNANEDASLAILHGRKQQWYFDQGTNKWYVGYGFENSDRELLFEAEADQMDALFGIGGRPTNYNSTPFRELSKRTNITFSGNVAEMEGEGWFEDEVAKVQALALDEGRLPSWMENDPRALESLYIAQAEGKDDEWLMRQWSSLPSFQTRFPGMSELQKTGNLTLAEGVTAFLEYESGVKQTAIQYGKSPEEITPEVIAGLMGKGYTMKYVTDVFSASKRQKEYAPALEAFNQVLAQQGQQPLTGEDQINFMMGRAPQEIYDVYEASSYQEAANKVGLGALFQADDAIRSALQSPGMVSLEQTTEGMQQAAQLLLRLRGEIDTGAYGLNNDDLIDLSLNLKPRSGVPESELRDSIYRATQSAKTWIESSGGKPFTSFSGQGVPQASSLQRARPA